MFHSNIEILGAVPINRRVQSEEMIDSGGRKVRWRGWMYLSRELCSWEHRSISYIESGKIEATSARKQARRKCNWLRWMGTEEGERMSCECSVTVSNWNRKLLNRQYSKKLLFNITLRSKQIVRGFQERYVKYFNYWDDFAPERSRGAHIFLYAGALRSSWSDSIVHGHPGARSGQHFRKREKCNREVGVAWDLLSGSSWRPELGRF